MWHLGGVFCSYLSTEFNKYKSKKMITWKFNKQVMKATIINARSDILHSIKDEKGQSASKGFGN